MTEHQRQHDLDHDSNYHQDTEHDSNYQPAPQGDAPNYQPHAAEDRAEAHHDGAKEYAGAPEADRFEHGTDQGVVADGDRVVEVEEVEIIEEEGRA